MTGIFKTLKDKTVKLESIPRENVSQSEREIKTFEQIKTYRVKYQQSYMTKTWIYTNKSPEMTKIEVNVKYIFLC